MKILLHRITKSVSHNFDWVRLLALTFIVYSFSSSVFIANAQVTESFPTNKKSVDVSAINQQDFIINGSNIQTPVLLIEPKSGQILGANPAAQQFYGYPDLTQKTIQEINTFTPEQVAQERANALSQGRNYFLFRHQLADGSSRKVEVFSFPSQLKNQSVLVSFILDIEHSSTDNSPISYYQQSLETLVDRQTDALNRGQKIQFALLSLALLIALVFVGYLAINLRKSRHMQRHLFEAKSHLSATLDALPDLLFELDEKGVFLNFHASKQGKLYMPPEEFLGKHVNDCLPPELAKLTLENIEAMKTTGQLAHTDYSLPIDGEQEFYELTASVKPNPLAKNHADSYVFLSRNHTGRVKAEASLRRNEENLRQISENISEILWLRDMQSSKIIYISPVYETVWGRSCESLYADNTTFIEAIYEEDKPEVLRSYQQMADKGAFENTYRICKPDGEIRWVHAKGRLITDQSSGQLREVGRAVDITELKLKEQQLEFAASVFSYAREAIVITQPDSTIVDVNESFSDITGYSKSEIIGQKIHLLKSGHHPPRFFKALWESLQHNGYWTGEIWNKRKNGETYPQLTTISTVYEQADSQTPSHYVILFSDISEQKQHQKQLEYMANFDELTQLPNRRLLSERLQHAMFTAQGTGAKVGVAFVDLDGFKTFNDAYGHNLGDDLLVQVSKNMSQVLRKVDTLSRIGGDEFVVVFEQLPSQEDLLPLLHRLLEAVRSVQSIHDKPVQLSASIGVTIYPDDQVDAEQLIRHADQAMYQAKRSGKDQYAFFDIDQELAILSNQDCLLKIRRGLEQSEFVLHYQPQIDMQTSTILGFEALIRWHSKEEGLLYPNDFLPQISGHPLETEIDYWVIEKALKQLNRWQQTPLAMQALTLSVNVSGQLLLQNAFIDWLKNTLKNYPSDVCQRLEIEVLESSALADLSQVSKVIQQCQAMGVQFALDDFGTGYSSLTYLRYLPANLIKIDQSFIRDMLVDSEDCAIVEGIIGLASAFDRKVIAEGVETYEHAQMLLEMGCKLGQGYGIAKPMPIEQLDDWVQQWQQNGAWLAAQPNQNKS